MEKLRYILLFVCVVLVLLAGCSKREDKPTAPQTPDSNNAVEQASAGETAAKTTSEIEEQSEKSAANDLLLVLPDDVVGFVAGRGLDNIRPSFEKSILGRMWSDPQMQSFFRSVLGQVKEKIKADSNDVEQTEAVNTVQSLLELVANRPIVAGIARKEAADGPPLYGFVILDAGQRKGEIAAAIDKLEGLGSEGDITEITVGSFKMHGPKNDGGAPGYWGWVNNYLVFAVNDGDGLAIRHLQQPRAASDVQDYLSNVPAAGGAGAMYVDCRKITEIAKAVAVAEGGDEEITAITTALDKLGLAGIGKAAVRMGFVGPDIVINEFVEAPQPRTGLPANFNSIDLKIFDKVDSRAVNAVAFNINTAGLYDTILSTIEAAAPKDVYGKVQEEITKLESEGQFNIRKQILGNLAGPVVGYAMPMGVIPESPGAGFMAFVQVKDGAALEKAMGALGQYIAKVGDGVVQVSSQESNGKTLHSWIVAPLAMAQIMPCWTIAGDQLVIGSSPAMCNLAVARISSADSTAQSIRGTDGFKQAMKNLPDNVAFLRYADSKVQVRQLMLGLQGMWPMATMTAKRQGIDLPVVLPSFDGIIEDIGPTCEYSWFDADGIHSRYKGSGIEANLGAVAGGGLAMGIVMPALARTRQQAKRMISMANMSQLGKSCLMYAADHKGKLPENFEVMKDYYGDPKVLESPRKPKGCDGPSYIYIKGQTINMEPGNIIVYENPEICDDKINVLFLDCHVEAMNQKRFLDELGATYKRLDQEMPDVKFKK